jgi:hypothetical protein
MALGDQRLKVLTDTDFPATPGRTIALRPQEGKLRCFDSQDIRLDLSVPAGAVP